MSRIYIPTTKPEDWQSLLADPEKQLEASQKKSFRPSIFSRGARRARRVKIFLVSGGGREKTISFLRVLSALCES